MTTNDDGSSDRRDDLLTVAVVRTWVVLAMRLLTAARPVINEANVFPVADSDTGTNLCLTLGDGRDALDALGATAGLDDALRALARGALMGARGNSGIILSEYLRGFALGVAGQGGPGRGGVGRGGTDAVVAGLREASRCAYDAVGHPREGTILTAAAGAARAAGQALEAPAAPPAQATGLRDVVDLARAGAQDALERSVQELDVLRTAGMLDAGAYGLVLILDALGLALTDAAAPAPVRRGSRAAAEAMSEAVGMITIMDSLAVAGSASHLARTEDDGALDRAHDRALGHHTATDGEFEVMFVVGHTGAGRGEIDAIAPTLRERLLAVGDSVVVVGGADEASARTVTGTWQVHVHTDRPLDALRVAGGWTQRQIIVRSLPHQVAARAHGAQPLHGVVACTAAPGLVADLARSGAVVVLRGTAAIGRDDLRRGALETTATRVTLLPSDVSTARWAHDLAVQAAQAAQTEAGTGPLPALDVVDSVSDLHVVTAMSAWASAADAAPEPDAAPEAASRRLAAVHAAVAAMRAVMIDGSDPVGVRDALSELLGDVRNGPDAVLTVLAGDLVGDRVTDEIAAEAVRRCPGIEVVVLASGRRSVSLVMGVDEP